MQRKVHHYSIRPEEQMPVDICNKKHQNDMKKGKVLRIFYCIDSLHMNVFKENTAHHSRDDKMIIKTLAKKEILFLHEIYICHNIIVQLVT